MTTYETNGGYLLSQNRTYDYEDSRTTYRLQSAMLILKGLGIEPSVNHANTRTFDWAVGREHHECDWRCVVAWPEWATPEMFDMAYRLADKAQTARGEHNRRGVK